MISPAPLLDPAVLARCVRLGALLSRLEAAYHDRGLLWALAPSWCAAGGPDPEVQLVIGWVGRDGDRRGAALRPIVGRDMLDVLERAAAMIGPPRAKEQGSPHVS